MYKSKTQDQGEIKKMLKKKLIKSIKENVRRYSGIKTYSLQKLAKEKSER